MDTVTEHYQSPIRLELTQDQVLHLAASIASDLDSASDLMPPMFEIEHEQLYNILMEKLSAAQRKRVEDARPAMEDPS